MRSRNNGRRVEETPVRIESLTGEGSGVARIDGKVVFIDGALPGETVMFEYMRKARRHDEGVVTAVLEASPDRVEPACPHFGVCGGCAMQHLASDAQLHFKQQALLDNFERIGGVAPVRVLDPLTGPEWGYRRKARLGAKCVPKKGGVLIGFRERHAHLLADLHACHVLQPAVGMKFDVIREFMSGLDAKARIPQVEIAVGDDETVLVFRHLDPLSDADRERLRRFGEDEDFRIWLQPGGPKSAAPLDPQSPPGLSYSHPDFQVRVDFHPLDFVQVNAEINRRMVQLAIDLLDVGPEHRVLDLYCGLGNFTLPLARCAGHVTGVEGDAGMVERARQNAHANGIFNTDCFASDLGGDVQHAPWLKKGYDRVLLDPPRAGAREIIASIGGLGAERIVYVACDPATLARDAGALVKDCGYVLEAAGVMDMFPHTAHVESIALFTRR